MRWGLWNHTAAVQADRRHFGLEDIGPGGRGPAVGTGFAAVVLDTGLADVVVRIACGHVRSAWKHSSAFGGLPLLVLVVWCYLLAVLESAMGRRSVLLVVVLLVAAIVALVATLLWRVAGLLVAALVVALLGRILALALRRVLLVPLVVLVVRAGHCGGWNV